MREMNETGGRDLALTAFLYANGELDPVEAEAFEQRLGDDQTAREMLLQAVQLSQTTMSQPIRPDPSYREAVRERLQPVGVWKWFTARRWYRGHPVAWCGLGATAAILSMLWLNPAQPGPRELSAAQPEHAALPAAPAADGFEPVDASAEVANIWAGLRHSDRLSRAREEEQQRKTRVEERSRITRGTEGRPRVLSHPMTRP
jgi:hypothetical protein